MGKKDKKTDKEKVEAKKARQVAKQQKVAVKRNKKETKDLGEEDIESIIADIRAKDLARTAVTISVCPQPSPRSNFSMTALPNGDMLMFGGEFCDGEGTVVYNDLYRWNIEKNEWKKIESLNNPPPRCSHQAVFYKDMWSLDLKTNAWHEMKTSGDIPSARSGHRMALWRNYIVLFGGFYEALREVRWYNDTFIYSFQDEKWTEVVNKNHAQVPKPRSGVQLVVSAIDDLVYVYGGYSKEKVSGLKKEGKVHDDMWTLSLKGVLIGAIGSKLKLDPQKAVWTKISKKGTFPSQRCGAALVLYKNKGLVFGGVFDEEGPRHAMVSTFYNDMFAFDTER
eukprot:gene3368-6669_t